MKNLFGLRWKVFLVIFLQYGLVNAQTGAGFTENKGQWEGNFRFKANIPSGNFFIDPNGYTILQYNADDVNKLMGHHQSQMEKRIEPVKITPPGEDGNSSNKSELTVRKHAYRVTFLGTTNQTKSKAEKPTGERSNFFLGNDPSKWKTDVESFSAVRVENMYPGIDVKYYTYNDRIKFDILVESGANPSAIKLKYEGADKIEIVKGELVITTSLGVVKELKPYAYQIIGGIKVEVPCSYQLSNNQVSYKLQGYNKNAPLVIDPEVLWLSTYTGSLTDNWGYTAAPGPDKSIYAAGIVKKSGYPVSTGAYQTRNNSSSDDGWDIGITRIARNGDDPASNLIPKEKGFIFSTFLGGINDEYPHSLIVDNNGDVVILGRTQSENNFPHTKEWGATGGWDIFVFKLSADGKMMRGSMLIGGSEDDGYNHENKIPPSPKTETPYRLNYGDCSRSEVVLDDLGNIFIASNTFSSNFRTQNAAFPNSKGNQEGVLMKINSNLTDVLFSTFIGGSEFDAAVCLGYDPLTKRVIVGGYTESADFRGVGSGLGKSGQLDGFLSVFENNGVHVVSNYFGTPSHDYIYAVQVDKLGFPYILGISYGVWANKNPPSSTIYPNAKGKQFVAKIQPDLSDIVFSAKFGSGLGSEHDISPIAFLVDQCNRIFVAGWTNSAGCSENKNAKTMLTKNPIKKAPFANGDGKDFYFLVFEEDCADVRFASFWGQQGGSFDHVDGGTSRFDKQGVIYMASCGNCGSSFACEGVDPAYRFPLKSAADQNKRLGNLGDAFCNMHALILDFGLGEAVASITPFIDGVAFKKNGCDNLEVRFVARSSEDEVIELPTDGSLVEGLEGVTYEWDFGPLGTKTGRDVTMQFPYNPAIPQYKVTLKVKDPNKVCKPEDINEIFIKVGIEKAILDASYNRPDCKIRKVDFTNLTTGVSSFPFSSTSFIWNFEGKDLPPSDNGIVSYTFPTDGRYKVKLKLNDPNYCNDGEVFEFDVFISENVVPTLDYKSPVCLDPVTNKVKVEFKAGGGPDVKWQITDPGNNEIYQNHSDLNVSFEFNAQGNYIVKLDVTDPNACNKNAIAQYPISVYPSPKSNFSFSTPQENTPVSFTNLSDNLKPSDRRFLWDFRDGDTSNLINPSHLFNFTKKYDVKLLAIDIVSGCRDSTTKTIFTKVSPLVNIPNAFTPLAATNNRFGVLGFGIIRVDLKIFNRWGVKVFDSQTSGFKSWDGTYNGQLQPMDVYTYLGMVYFSDGESQPLKGDVTLIR